MNIIQNNAVLPKGVSLIIIGIIISAGTEILYPYIVAPYETSLFEYEDLWGISLSQNQSFSKELFFEEEVDEIILFVDYEPLWRNLQVEILDENSNVIFKEEISRQKFVKTFFSPEPNSSYEFRITNLDRFYVEIWDLGYENYFPEKSDYVAPDDEWYSYLAVVVFLLGISIVIIGVVLFYKGKQKNKIYQTNASGERLHNALSIFKEVVLNPKNAFSEIGANGNYYFLPSLGIFLGTFFFAGIIAVFIMSGFAEESKRIDSDVIYSLTITSIFSSLFSYFIFYFVLYYLGKRLGGVSNFKGIFSALQYAVFPAILSGLLFMVYFVSSYEVDIFRFEDQVYANPIFYGIITPISIWSLILFVLAVRECNKFSLLKSIGILILASIIVYIISAILQFIVMFGTLNSMMTNI
jgi:hypothetical protein